MTPEFKTAKFYTCDDCAERLTHGDWMEALADYLEERSDEGEVDLAVIVQEAPITVWAYVTQKPTGTSFDNLIDYMIESANENWQEEYGDQSGGFDEVEGPVLTDAEQKIIEVILDTAWRRATPWTCDQVAQHTFTQQELVKLYVEKD